MSISHEAILEVAERLATSSSEADMRSAISRAYYAVFHGTLDALPPDRRPKADFSGSSHEAVIQEAKGYINARVPLPGRSDAIRVCEKLPRLKAKRKLADYELQVDIDPPSVERVMAEARLALSYCREWKKKRTEAGSV